MSYSRNKVWIAAEILTAANLNTEFDGCITNENDLDSRLISEITARTTLEGEYDTFYAAAWNAGSSQIANNKVALASMKDNSVGTSELVAQAVTRAKLHDDIIDPAVDVAGARTLGTGATQAMPGNTTPIPSDNSVTSAKLKDTVAGTHLINIVQETEYCHNATSYTKITEIRIGIDGAIRTKFHLRRYDTTGTAYGRIYKNGNALGTERSNTSSAGVWYEEDLSGLQAGDLLQLYTKQSTSAGQVCVKDFSLSITDPLKNIVTLES